MDPGARGSFHRSSIFLPAAFSSNRVGTRYQFGTFVLDTAQGVLLERGEPVALTPKALTLLEVLVSQPGRVLSKQQLHEAVWPDVVVEEANLPKLVNALRSVLGRAAIETLSKRGYRFAARLTPDPAAAIGDGAAWRHYLEGRYLWNRRPGPVVFQAMKQLERAIELAPGFAPAWAGLADIYATLGSWESGVLPHAEAQAKAWAHASKALELDPSLSAGHSALGYALLHYGWDAKAADARFRQSLELDPSAAGAHHWHAHGLAAQGRFDEALAHGDRALALDPMNLLLHVHQSWHWHMARQPKRVLEQSERVVRLDGAFHWGHYFEAWGAEATGDPKRAVRSMRRAVKCAPKDPVMAFGLARALAAAGEKKAALSLAKKSGGLDRFGYEHALVHLALGERDAAITALERALQMRSGWLIYAGVDPRLDPLRSQPRFTKLLNDRAPLGAPPVTRASARHPSGSRRRGRRSTPGRPS
jgi:DNA-binding winged helix-turn-helix (wHTH) protein/tetratricopeptide (TPR) repeat protein